MIADDKVTPLPTLLERIGQRIDQAWQRTRKGADEWIEGSLELAQALAEGRGRFSADKAFGDWLVLERHDHVNKNDRAALIGMATDLALAREVLTKTESRSYDLIWRGVQDRFPSVRKPDKPKRGRRAKGTGTSKATHQRDKAREAIEAMEANGEIVLRDTVVKRARVSNGTADTAIAEHFATKEATAKAHQTAAEDQDIAGVSAKGKIKLEDAIRIHKARLDKQFEQRVNAEVRRQIDAASDFTRQENKRLRQEVHSLNQTLSDQAVFTKEQYRHMLMLCHPDSSASPQLKAELLQVLVEKKKRLVKQ